MRDQAVTRCVLFSSLIHNKFDCVNLFQDDRPEQECRPALNARTSLMKYLYVAAFMHGIKSGLYLGHFKNLLKLGIPGAFSCFIKLTGQ